MAPIPWRIIWIILLKTNRLFDAAGLHLRDAHGWMMPLPGSHLAVDELVLLIPPTAYRPVTVSEDAYRRLTLAFRIPGLGRVRMVVSVEPKPLTGRSEGLVTNRADWSAAKLSSLDGQRWATATCDQAREG